jgi:hypothetical protein
MLSKTHLTTAVVLVTALFGCSSFNNYQYPPPLVLVMTAANPPGTTNTTTTSVTSAIPVDCVYRQPELQPIPREPIQELEKVGFDDGAALDQIQQDYIKQLQKFIRGRQAAHYAAYQDYLKRCKMLTPRVPDDGKNTGS